MCGTFLWAVMFASCSYWFNPTQFFRASVVTAQFLAVLRVEALSKAPVVEHDATKKKNNDKSGFDGERKPATSRSSKLELRRERKKEAVNIVHEQTWRRLNFIYHP